MENLKHELETNKSLTNDEITSAMKLLHFYDFIDRIIDTDEIPSNKEFCDTFKTVIEETRDYLLGTVKHKSYDIEYLRVFELIQLFKFETGAKTIEISDLPQDLLTITLKVLSQDLLKPKISAEALKYYYANESCNYGIKGPLLFATFFNDSSLIEIAFANDKKFIIDRLIEDAQNKISAHKPISKTYYSDLIKWKERLSLKNDYMPKDNLDEILKTFNKLPKKYHENYLRQINEVLDNMQRTQFKHDHMENLS